MWHLGWDLSMRACPSKWKSEAKEIVPGGWTASVKVWRWKQAWFPSGAREGCCGWSCGSWRCDRWYSIISGQKVGLDVEGQRISKELRLLPVCMGSSKGFRQGSHTLCFTAIFKNHCLQSLKYTYFCMSPYVAPGTSFPYLYLPLCIARVPAHILLPFLPHHFFRFPLLLPPPCSDSSYTPLIVREVQAVATTCLHESLLVKGLGHGRGLISLIRVSDQPSLHGNKSWWMDGILIGNKEKARVPQILQYLFKSMWDMTGKILPWRRKVHIPMWPHLFSRATQWVQAVRGNDRRCFPYDSHAVFIFSFVMKYMDRQTSQSIPSFFLSFT